MKFFSTTFVLSLIFSAQLSTVFVEPAQAGFASNSYAPTLETVVVLYSPIAKTYSLFPYNMIDGEAIELGRDPSCESIQVHNNSDVICISSTNSQVTIGTLQNVVGRQDEWQAISVRVSYTRAQIVEKRTKDGVRYVLAVK